MISLIIKKNKPKLKLRYFILFLIKLYHEVTKFVYVRFNDDTKRNPKVEIKVLFTTFSLLRF